MKPGHGAPKRPAPGRVQAEPDRARTAPPPRRRRLLRHPRDDQRVLRRSPTHLGHRDRPPRRASAARSPRPERRPAVARPGRPSATSRGEGGRRLGPRRGQPDTVVTDAVLPADALRQPDAVAEQPLKPGGTGRPGGQPASRWPASSSGQLPGQPAGGGLHAARRPRANSSRVAVVGVGHLGVRRRRRVERRGTARSGRRSRGPAPSAAGSAGCCASMAMHAGRSGPARPRLICLARWPDPS